MYRLRPGEEGGAAPLELLLQELHCLPPGKLFIIPEYSLVSDWQICFRLGMADKKGDNKI